MLALAGCSGLVSLELPPPRQADMERDWLTLGRNPERQHYSPQNINPPLQVAWKRSVKSVVVDHPLALGDYIFASTRSGLLYMIDYETGNGLGSGRIGLSMEHSPTIHNNYLYAGVTLGEKTLLGMDLTNADKVLNEKYPHVNTTPLVQDNKIYFGTNTHLFFCSNLNSGQEIWRFEANAPIHSSPAMKDEAVVFGDDKGWIYALDGASGIVLWERQLQGSVFSHPVLDDSSAYVGTVAGIMYALDLNDGSILWQTEFPGSIYSSAALYGNMLYVGNNAHEVVALRKSDGNRIWKFKTGGIVNTVPLPSPDYLYVGSWDKYLYVLNRFSGKLIFKYPLSKPPKSSPIIYRDYVLVHTANHELIALANENFLDARRDSE